MFDAGARAPQDARMRIASLIASSTVIVADGNQYFNALARGSWRASKEPWGRGARTA
ncbi:MAG: hypothetical protein LC647_06645 [Beggiatoa sp.]|nr:hypothetical protein [Beggiatoa sp.]